MQSRQQILTVLGRYIGGSRSDLSELKYSNNQELQIAVDYLEGKKGTNKEERKKRIERVLNHLNKMKSESPKKDQQKKIKIEKETLFLVDYDNVYINKECIENLSQKCSFIIVCHLDEQEKALKELKIKGLINIVNVKNSNKQSSDMKIYGLLIKAKLLGVKDIIVLSKDKGFDIFCTINKINAKRLESFENLILNEEKVKNYSTIDKFENAVDFKSF